MPGLLHKNARSVVDAGVDGDKMMEKSSSLWWDRRVVEERRKILDVPLASRGCWILGGYLET